MTNYSGFRVFALTVFCQLALVASQICNKDDPNSGGKVIPAVGASGTATVCEYFGGEPVDGCEPSENDPQPMAVFYLICLLYTFMGVGVIAEVFMSAIEVITSKSKMLEASGPEPGSVVEMEVLSWNPTIANLTLMALGSSAPEIMLSIIEILGDNFYSGALGPGTIVGSAAFNLLIIIGVCVIAIPPANGKNETGTRKIEELGVYGLTASCSIFAYMWLIVILSDNAVEIWEGTITFLFFPLLVGLAYIIDVGYCKCGGMKRVSPEPVIKGVTVGGEKREFKGHEAMALLKGHQLDKDVDPEVAARFAMGELEKSSHKSRAYWRIQANRELRGGKTVDTNVDESALQAKGGTSDAGVSSFVGFASDKYSFLENCVNAELTVVREPIDATDINKVATVKYRTVQGTAEAEKDYTHTEGTLTFDAENTKQTILVPIVDDDAIETDEFFTVELYDAEGVLLSEHGGTQALVKIIDDDAPGTIQFATTGTGTGSAEYDVSETIGKAKIKLVRMNGAKGTINVRVQTKDGSAVDKRDYNGIDEVVSFHHGELEKTVEIPIVNDECFEKTEYFSVKISKEDDTSLLGSVMNCRVNILNDDDIQKLSERVAALMNINMDKLAIGKSSWSSQFSESVSIEGDNCFEKTLCIITIPWKFLFAFTPPAQMCGGWLTFIVALGFITVVTLLIGDFAALFGCSIGLKDAVTAITFVALGTSLPDTFASMSSAKSEATADNSVGNVTGSNSVNVFMGLGLPWMIASMYWGFGIASDESMAEWRQRYSAVVVGEGQMLVIEKFPDGVFVVEAGDLNFSVIVFSTCACVCLCTLSLRRKVLGYELGGKYTYPTFFFFLLLWFIYILMSAMKTYGHI